MTQTYIEYLFPGIIVSDSSEEKVSDRTLPKKIPKGCFGFRFFERMEEKIDGEKLIGKPKKYSNWYYAKGDVLTLEEVKVKHSEKKILIGNMENNDIAKVLMTKFGQAIPLEEKDVVLDY